jgi:small subunit ribosomal protein S6
MRLYELTLIIDSSLDESTIQSEIEKIENRITDSGGKIHRLDRWGLRRLAYEIKKHSQGYYVFFLFEANPGLTGEIEKNLKLNENILRYLTILSPTDVLAAGKPEQAGETGQVDEAAPVQE